MGWGQEKAQTELGTDLRKAASGKGTNRANVRAGKQDGGHGPKKNWHERGAGANRGGR